MSTIHHVKGCSLEMDKKTKRYVLFKSDKLKGNLLFVSDWKNGYYSRYSLYSIDDEEARTIIDLVVAEDLRKARRLLRQAKHTRWYYEEGDKEILDDVVPADWYDIWLEFEGFLTLRIHYEGVIEQEVNEADYC